MTKTEQQYYSIQFIEDEDGRTFVIFYDQEGKAVAKREILGQDVTKAVRLGGENN
jgi:hypothetical protein